MDHVMNSMTHKKRSKVQTGPFNEIDQIIAELNTKQKWIHAWKTEQPIHSEYPEESEMPIVMAKRKPPTPFRLRPLDTVKNIQEQ